tara:strand:+ start:350 stop:496 length:147 start_codon:yes stop_codon:yes gene_type:complete
VTEEGIFQIFLCFEQKNAHFSCNAIVNEQYFAQMMFQGNLDALEKQDE